MSTYVYDSGALIALESGGDQLALHRHRSLLKDEHRILIPAVVAAQVVRQPDRQARLMRALSGCDLVPFTSAHHVAVGRLLAASGTSDVAHAFVALLAAQVRALVVSSDPGDIRRLLGCLGARQPVLPA